MIKKTVFFFLPICMTNLSLLYSQVSSGSDPQKLLNLRERIHAALEKRFFSPENVLYDYVGENGEVVTPTPEECQNLQPNAFAWNTPIENGGFFNGLLLTGLTEVYKKHPSEKLQKQMRRLLHGLFVLQDFSPVPGCILRGIASDGRSSYPASSNDQVIPFLLGLRQYAHSPAADEKERIECMERCRKLCLALEKNNWIIPGARPGFERGNILTGASYHNCHILLCAMILDEVEEGKNKRFTRIFEKRRDGIVSGYPEIKPSACWYSSSNFYIMRLAGEEHPEYRDVFLSGLQATAEGAKKHLSEWKKYDSSLSFSPDWHALNAVWKEQKNSKEGDEVAAQQWAIWRRTSPIVMNERESVMASLAAAWIVLLSGDQKLIAESEAPIREMLESIPYEKLHYSPFFFAENVISELL